MTLVFQQFAVLETNIDQKVERFCGAMGCDLWSKQTWKKHFEQNKESKWFIGRLPIGANAKALADVVKHFQSKDKEKSVYMFGGDKEEGAVVHSVYVGTVSVPDSVPFSTCRTAH